MSEHGPICSGLFFLPVASKYAIAYPLLALLSVRTHARFTCSVASVLSTVLLSLQTFFGFESYLKTFHKHLFCNLFTAWRWTHSIWIQHRFLFLWQPRTSASFCHIITVKNIDTQSNSWVLFYQSFSARVKLESFLLSLYTSLRPFVLFVTVFLKSSPRSRRRSSFPQKERSTRPLGCKCSRDDSLSPPNFHEFKSQSKFLTVFFCYLST